MKILFAHLNKKILLLSLAFALLSQSRASGYQDLYTSVRALGMGNAYTAVASELDALWYNPAGLARNKGLRLTVFDLQMGSNGLKVYEKYQEYGNSGDNLATFLNSLYGENMWAHAHFRTGLTLPYFGVGLFGAGDLEALLDNPAYPSFELEATADYGFMTGMAVPLVPEMVALGFNLRRTTRLGSRVPLEPSIMANLNTQNIEDELKREGIGYGIDMGLNVTFPTAVKPTISLVWKNMGVTSFKHVRGPGAPAAEQDEVVLGFGLDIGSKKYSITPAFDIRHVNRGNMHIGNKLNMGFEVSLPVLDLRAGFHQGYYTLGASTDLGFFRVDAATYGVELGTYPGQLEDRRYVVQATFELGFNPQFGGSGSTRRHLKQRR